MRIKGKRMGERNLRSRRLLVSCLSRVILEPQCITHGRPTLTAGQTIDPALISRAIVQETLCTQAHRRDGRRQDRAGINLIDRPLASGTPLSLTEA